LFARNIVKGRQYIVTEIGRLHWYDMVSLTPAFSGGTRAQRVDRPLECVVGRSRADVLLAAGSDVALQATIAFIYVVLPLKRAEV